MYKCPSLSLPSCFYREKGKGTYRYVLTLPYIQIPILRKTHLKEFLSIRRIGGIREILTSIKLLEIELELGINIRMLLLLLLLLLLLFLFRLAFMPRIDSCKSFTIRSDRLHWGILLIAISIPRYKYTYKYTYKVSYLSRRDTGVSMSLFTFYSILSIYLSIIEKAGMDRIG